MWLFDVNKKYRYILILESRDWWANCRDNFDPARDLVLTYDFALKLEVNRLGGQAFYIDHLVDKRVMNEHNFPTYRFFRDWHFDGEGKDIFTYRGVSFGFTFRLDIWNDYIFYVRNRICLEALRTLSFEKLLAGTQLGIVEGILGEMGLPFSPVSPGGKEGQASYFFPIHRWMDEKVRYQGIRGIKYRLRDMASVLQGTLMSWIDQALEKRNDKPTIFIQLYYQTFKLVQRLNRDSRVRLLLASFSRSPGWFRYIPVWGGMEKYQDDANAMMQNFRAKRCSRLVFSNGVNATETAYRIIDERIASRIVETVRTLDCVMRYLDKNPIKLLVLGSNVGLIPTLVDCVTRNKGIPSYLIINGVQSGDFLDESKYATIINAYSTSIKDHYYRGMDNIVCLGDPRMDPYVRDYPRRVVNRDTPTVTIGTSAHSNVDLNSFLAVEFDFMYDMLFALQIIQKQGVDLRIVFKVRANGYREQYKEFVKDYFPGMVVEILDQIPMINVLEQTDLYVSAYSYSFFEASCLGIPCLYYKNDCEMLVPPYDGNSELVTVNNIDDLVQAITDFRFGHERYDAFLDKSVLEKYVGPLDGGSLERNLQFIYGFLERTETVK